MSRFLHRWRAWVLLVTCMGGVGALLAFNLNYEHDRIESRERERLTKQTKVIAVNLTRQLVAINLALDSVIAELPDWVNQPDAQATGTRHLKGMVALMPSVRTFLVLDAKGTAMLSNREELIGQNFVQREYFQVHLQSRMRNTLHVSPPFKSVLNVYVINLTRAITGPQGEFAGVVSATVDPVEIKGLLNSVLYADDMRSTLAQGDGKIFVSEPPGSGVAGEDFADLSSFFSQHLKKQREVSDFNGIVDTSGYKRLSVLQIIQPGALAMDKPLVAGLSREWAAVFAPWQRDARNQLLAYALFMLLCSTGLFIYQRQRRRQRLSEQRLKLATEAAGVGIWEFNLADRRYHWEPAMFVLFGLDPRLANDRNDNWRQLVLPGELERIKVATRGAIEQHHPFVLTFQIRRGDGQIRFLRNRAAFFDDGSDAPSRLIGTTEDVTERRIREADLRIAATAFEANESMFITDAHAVILRVNCAFTHLCGYEAAEAVGHTPRLLRSGRHDAAFYATLRADLKRDGAWQGEIWNRRKDGQVFPAWLSITAVCNEEGAVTHYVCTHADITLRKAAEEEIMHLAFYDPLTRLPNRRLLHDRLRQAVVLAKRNNSRLALLFIDLDKFKPVNDAFGHRAGDDLLQAVAKRLQACVRESDTVARLGGDEFVVLLATIETTQDVVGVAEKVHAVLMQPFILPEGQTVSISSSSGIAIYPEHGRDEAELLSHADEAMYQAKTDGRDRFGLFAPSPDA